MPTTYGDWIRCADSQSLSQTAQAMNKCTAVLSGAQWHTYGAQGDAQAADLPGAIYEAWPERNPCFREG